MPITVKAPDDCTDAELAEFCELVESAGQVIGGGLPGRVRRAMALAFLYLDDRLSGTAALKTPNAGYHRGVFRKASSELDPAAYPLELGWVFVLPDFQGAGHSRYLTEAVLGSAEGGGAYATTSSERMRRTLERCGFVPDGEPYRSEQNPGENLRLFVLRPPG